MRHKRAFAINKIEESVEKLTKKSEQLIVGYDVKKKEMLTLIQCLSIFMHSLVHKKLCLCSAVSTTNSLSPSDSTQNKTI